jgi:hypothetical protein
MKEIKRIGYSNTMLSYYIDYEENDERKIKYFDTPVERVAWITENMPTKGLR